MQTTMDGHREQHCNKCNYGKHQDTWLDNLDGTSNHTPKATYKHSLYPTPTMTEQPHGKPLLIKTIYIYQLLIKRHTHKISISNKSPFVTGPLVDDIGQYGNNTIVDQILDETITHIYLGLSHEEVDKELETLLRCLQRANTSDGTPMKDMEGTISLGNYKSLFKKTNEKRRSSPSKIHMGHHIASCEHDRITQVYCTIMLLSFIYGLTLG